MVKEETFQTYYIIFYSLDTFIYSDREMNGEMANHKRLVSVF